MCTAYLMVYSILYIECFSKQRYASKSHTSYLLLLPPLVLPLTSHVTPSLPPCPPPHSLPHLLTSSLPHLLTSDPFVQLKSVTINHNNHFTRKTTQQHTKNNKESNQRSSMLGFLTRNMHLDMMNFYLSHKLTLTG